MAKGELAGGGLARPARGRHRALAPPPLRWLFLSVLLVLTAPVPAMVDGEAGRPHIEQFNTRDHPGAPQNWALVQDRRGLVYVGNNIGVLEFDGVRWRLIEVSNRSAVRSLALAGDGRILIGANNEFGQLVPDASGQLVYESMVGRLDEGDREFGDVMGVFDTPRGVVISTRSDLFRLGVDRVEHWPAEFPYHLAFALDDEIFILHPGQGMKRLGTDGLEPVPGGQVFAEQSVQVLLPLPDGSRLVCARVSVCQRWEGERVEPWPTEVDAKLAQAMLYAGTILPNGHIALATIRDGVYVLDTDGALVDVLDTNRGLPENIAISMLVDDQAGLWLGMDNHIVRLKYPDPLSYFGRLEGLDAAMVSLHRHGGVLYAGTNLGLLRLRTEVGAPPRFEAVAGIAGQTWQLQSWDERLLVANAAGVFQIVDGAPLLIRRSRGHSMVLLRSESDPSRLYIGGQDGLASLRLEGQAWVDEGPVSGVEGMVRSLAEDRGFLWVGPQGAELLRLALPLVVEGGASRSPTITRFGNDDGLPVLTNLFLFKFGGELKLASYAGIRRLIPGQERFEYDPELNLMYADPGKAGYVYAPFEDAAGRLWISTEAGRGALVPKPGDGYEWADAAMRPIDWPSSAIHVDPDGTSWWGGAEGLVRLEGAALETPERAPVALLRQVTDQNGAVLYGGAGSGTAAPQLASDRRALRFEFGAPNYDYLDGLRFQTRLDGVDSDWSPFSAETYRDYTNLGDGDYRFQVRVRDIYGRESAPAEWSFSVLPPWYRTWWAYLSYLLLGALLLRQLVRFRLQRLRLRNRELEDLIDRRTLELARKNTELEAAYRGVEEASRTDPLTGLRNRRFLADAMRADAAESVRDHSRWMAEGRPGLPPAADHLVYLVDIDHFKDVNDRFGHAAGDRLLTRFAELLREVFRDTDHLVRWGGEEFLVVARHTSRAGASALAERLRARIDSEPFDLGDGRTLARSGSIGFACFPFLPGAPEAVAWERVIDLADHALYEAKQQGRNAWVGIVAEAAVGADFDVSIARDVTSLLAAPGVRVLRSVPDDRSRQVQTGPVPAVPDGQSTPG